MGLAVGQSSARLMDQTGDSGLILQTPFIKLKENCG
jgi:hypothetical protein